MIKVIYLFSSPTCGRGVRGEGSNKQQGIVLVSCLLLVLILSLFVVSGLENSQLALKKGHYYQTHAQLMQAAEHGLLAGERHIQLGNHAICLHPTAYNTFYAEQSTEWWQQRCRWDDADPYSVAYVLEALPEQGCVLEGSVPIKARYWRVTARAWSDAGGFAVLQSTVVAADQQLSYCDIDERIITVGRQAWRRVSE